MSNQGEYPLTESQTLKGLGKPRSVRGDELVGNQGRVSSVNHLLDMSLLGPSLCSDLLGGDPINLPIIIISTIATYNSHNGSVWTKPPLRIRYPSLTSIFQQKP